MCVLLGLLSRSAWARDAGASPDAGEKIAQVTSIPAARQADKVAVVTVHGAIDAVTALSVRRRIEAAEKAGFDAMVFEIDSPGGELGAVLEISNAIKSSSITNTVAWVHPDAYSGGSIVALACREIVSGSPGSFGDSMIVDFGTGRLRTLSPDERTKLLPPLMAEVTDSARRSGYDEYLVQAIVVDGIELWLVENAETGERLAINEQEYRMLFDGEPIRGKPMLAEVKGGVKTYRSPSQKSASSDTGASGDGAAEEWAEGDGDKSDAAGPTGALPEDPNAYRPASETLRDIAREMARRDPNATEQVVGQEYPSNRVVITPADKGKYRFIGYITDGSAAIVMREDQMDYFGFSSGIVQDEQDLAAFMGAKQLVRFNESPTEKLARFLSNIYVRYVLIVVLLISLFVEMVMAGTGIAGAVALGALVLLLGPSAMIGLSGWWEVIAIVVGIVCLALEAFVIPGFGVCGVIGFVALFAGLVGTFVTFGGTMSTPEMQRQLLTGAVTVLLALVTAGIGWWLIIRNARNLPLFDRLILSGASGVGGTPAKSMLHAIRVDDGSVRVGSEGVTTTPLYPLGQAEINGQIEDVHAAFGFIERGVAVRVVKKSGLRIEVEAIDETGARDGHDGGQGDRVEHA